MNINGKPSNRPESQAELPADEAAEFAGQADEELIDELELGDIDPFEVLAEELAAENAELKDKHLRAMAEMENIRRRAEREKAEATLYAASNFARDLLNVADNMSRALDALPEDQRGNLDEATSNLISGIEMTQREFSNVLERHGIKRLDPMGEKFDPHLHQAMFEVPGDAEPGTIVQVVQPGYVIGERVLRPAMVGVAAAAKA